MRKYGIRFKNLRIGLILIGLVTSLIFGLSIYRTRGIDGTYAKVGIEGASQSMTISVNVFDANGFPVSGAAIASESDSGLSSTELTDDNGFASIKPGETEVRALYVNGRKVWYSPFESSYLGAFFVISCESGLKFTVNCKSEHVTSPSD